MDNITHAFVGAAMAECAVPRDASSRTRAVFMCVGVVAANAPDVDLLYTSITEEPLGYLLHHRGHSHTLPGLAALGVLIWAGLLLLPQTRSAVRGVASWSSMLIGTALLSHLVMDSANSYGTHLFYPFSSRWFYGDAVFVLEPWLWAILGAALAFNAGRFWRVLIVLLTLAPIGAVVSLGVLPAGVSLALIGVVGAAAIAARALDRKHRAAAALLAMTAVFLLMPGVSRAAKREARRALATLDGAEILDIVADANPGVPWCWTVLTLQDAAVESAGALTASRATLSLLPGLWPAGSCASARLSARWSTDVAPSDAIVWHRRWRIDAEELRALYTGHCRARAWLQFGRVPYVANGRIVDLRFENPVGQNFTPTALDGRCPSYLTDWEPPRQDILEHSDDRR